MKRSGLVAICGRPNVGKSTLLNNLVGKKVSIISPKPETTRDNIRGILTEKDTQIVFIDTPGIHKPHDLLGKIMLTRAQSSLMEADIILFLIEEGGAFRDDDMNIIERLPKPEEHKPVVLIINKSDMIKKKEAILPLIEKAVKLYPFKEIIPMSAKNAKHIEEMLRTVRSYLKEGEFVFPESSFTDKGEEFMAEEIIREKILECTRHEIPHASAVNITRFTKKAETNKIHIEATIFIEKSSQKGIVVGKGAEMIKKIREMSQKEIQKALNCKVRLELWVDVKEKWKNNPESLADIGYA
ncbi:MAG: GTPase Era [Candidatus Omnitrophica bacterium]|nr:GTPase Era [Candidatus Omnitrophota bacterium]